MAASTSSEANQQKPKSRPPAFAKWPTVKILLPPSGRNSVQTDEWCFTFCSQSVAGRFHARDPKCSSICIRRVFPHEVQNIIDFKRHRVDADGKVKYPMPPEGQPSNIPRYLGGIKAAEGSKSDSDSEGDQSKPPPKYWNQGWYLWSTNNQRSAVDHIMYMNEDLARSAATARLKQKRQLEWLEYQNFLERTGWHADDETPPPEGKYWGHKRPPRPFFTDDEYLKSTLLIQLPPPTPPIWEKIDKLLAPSRQALGLFTNDLSSGTFIRFADRVWEKAFTDEPFLLAQRSWEKLSEAWKKSADDADSDNTKRR